MKFRVERDVLTEAVAWAARGLPVRPSIPVLAGLLIETAEGGDGLVLSTFDFETSARVSIPASVQDEGRALVSGRLLADMTAEGRQALLRGMREFDEAARHRNASVQSVEAAGPWPAVPRERPVGLPAQEQPGNGPRVARTA